MVQDKSKEKQFYETMFSDITDGHFIDHGYEEIYQQTVDIVPAGLVLDLGCGTGKHSVNLCKKGFHVVGMDLSSKAIQAANTHAMKEDSKVHLIVADAEYLPFKNDTFDLVFCALILHHFTDISSVSREIARVAKGHLFALETNALEPMTFLKFNIVNPLFKPSLMTPNQRALFPKKVQKVFEEKGFLSFEFSWIDIHVPYRGIVGVFTRTYALLTKILPVKYRCNKFVMSCKKRELLADDSRIAK